MLAGREHGIRDLDLRQTCNLAYAVMTEAMDAEERANLDALLASEPIAAPRVVSRTSSSTPVPRPQPAATPKSQGVKEMIAQLQRLGR